MKKLLLFAISAFPLFSSFSHEFPIVASQGRVKYEKKKFGWINTVGGPIDLINVTVTGGIRTDQELFAEYSTLAGLHIGKKAWLRHCLVNREAYIGENSFSMLDACHTTFQHALSINGSIAAENCHFLGDIKANSQVISLIGTVTENIFIYTTGCYDRPVVKLCKNSLVKGNICFDAENGLVIVDNSSYVNGGVYGGMVVEEPFGPFAE